MTNLTGVVRQLQKERQRVHGEMEWLNAALAALGSLGSLGRKPKEIRAHKKRRPMWATARKRIAAAQRARWAKWKKNKRNQLNGRAAKRILRNCTNPPRSGGFVQ